MTDTAHPTVSGLVDGWLELWNGEYGGADSLIAPDFRIHAALLDGADSGGMAGPAGTVAWIKQIRAPLPDLAFTIEVGPIVQNDHVALRWQAEGHYAGGFPGAAAPIGTRVRFTGTDLLRVHDDRLVEYWVNSDVHVLLASLQVGAVS